MAEIRRNAATIGPRRMLNTVVVWVLMRSEFKKV